MKTALHKIFLKDGATGSYLQSQFPAANSPLWFTDLNITEPLTVKRLHQAYIRAGIDLITTNTFRSNPAAVKRSGSNYTSEELVRAAVKIAKQAGEGNPDVDIIGSNPPAEDCYQQERTLSRNDLADNHHRHIDLLLEAGVDLIIHETISHLDELNIIEQYCLELKKQFVISLYFDDDLKLLSGELMQEIIPLLNESKAKAISFNCIPPVRLQKLLAQTEIKFEWGCYCNCGRGAYGSGAMNNVLTPEEYAEEMKRILSLQPRQPLFIGSCCGSNPDHTRALRNLLNNINENNN